MRLARRSMARFLAAAIAVTLAGTTLAESLRGWRDGPAGSLLSDEDYRRFGDLRTDAARRGFIDEFWRSVQVDAPSPRYRETFEKRCAAADARFTGAGVPGWRTDRGRVLVALGEPSAIRRQGGGADVAEQEIWTYGAERADGHALTMAFYHCLDGGYRLDPSCALDRDPTSVAYDDERAEYLQRIRDASPSIASGRVLSILAGSLRPIPGGVPLSTERPARATSSRAAVTPPRAAVTTPSAVHALENATYFFRAQDGTVLALLTVAVVKPREESVSGAGGAPARYAAVAFLQEVDRRGEPVDASAPKTLPLDLDATPAADAEGLVFLGRAYLRPGKSYAVRFAVKDEAREQLFVRNAVIGVPDLVRGFSASSIVPAEQFGPAAGEASSFQVGSEEVVPRAGGIFRRSELLRLYLQVYDAALDSRTSMPRVDVVFRFYRTGSGRSKRYGKPFSVRGAAGASMGLALPIGDWPAGPYRVEVDLHDRVAEQRILAEGSFTIAVD